MNPECILYNACIMVNASWQLGRFRFLCVRYNVLSGGRNPMVNQLLKQSVNAWDRKRGQIIRSHVVNKASK